MQRSLAKASHGIAFSRLVKIGYITNPNCTFCNEAVETIQHLLFYCAVPQAFWNDCNS